MKIIDTHCHLDVENFDADREQVLKTARSNNVHGFVIPAIERPGWNKLLNLCEQHEDLYPAVGLHPMLFEKHHESDLQRLQDYVKEWQPVAIGEIGLDFYIKNTNPELQTFFFNEQLKIAKKEKLPVIIHSRKAIDQVIISLKETAFDQGGIMHAFNGSIQQAQQLIDMGFKFGFGGMLTFERSNRLRKLAKELPLDALVLETDAPDMTVASHRGQRNSPEYLPEVLKAMAEVRGEAIEKIAIQTFQNSNEVLRLGL